MIPTYNHKYIYIQEHIRLGDSISKIFSALRLMNYDITLVELRQIYNLYKEE